MVIQDEQSQATIRTIRDTDGRALRPGYYELTGRGVKPRTVEVGEDELTCDLWVRTMGSGDQPQRVDELPADARLRRLPAK